MAQRRGDGEPLVRMNLAESSVTHWQQDAQHGGPEFSGLRNGTLASGGKAAFLCSNLDGRSNLILSGQYDVEWTWILQNS